MSNKKKTLRTMASFKQWAHCWAILICKQSIIIIIKTNQGKGKGIQRSLRSFLDTIFITSRILEHFYQFWYDYKCTKTVFWVSNINLKAPTLFFLKTLSIPAKSILPKPRPRKKFQSRLKGRGLARKLLTFLNYQTVIKHFAATALRCHIWLGYYH